MPTRTVLLVVLAVAASLVVLIWATTSNDPSYGEIRIPPILRYSKDWMGRG